ncbi:PREDICTED: WASH complex subunit CCDC53 homolog [Nicotiana attenuata]|uniref:WASH complex subunit CCDC53 homolog n=1 Tax=Nicotiana attenuata TaxID=49451 RepID=UPI0009058A72|nr:PREDICTED: WASH complex subunit CCDC53 homolog [Nicotiana attenuata]
MQTSVTAIQKQQLVYENHLQQLELRFEKIERGEVSGLPGLKEEVASMKTELHKMQNLEFDLSSLLPTDGDQVTGTAAPDLGLDFSTLMTDTAPPTAGTSQPPSPPVRIDIPDEEVFGRSTESEDEEADEGEEKESSWSSEDDGPQEKGKHVVVPTNEEVEQAKLQTAIEHSLADLAAPADSSATQPSVGEASSSQVPAPAPVLDQPEIPTAVEVPPQTEPSSVPALASESDPTTTEQAIDSHSA